jgi:2-octaprenyl-6-methoxyphenol hydroxylase
MGQVFNQAMLEQQNLDLICPANVTELEHYDEHIGITLNDGQQLSANLIVAADGANSTIRRLLDLAVTERDYQQVAITANISTERPHLGKAFERFTESGPVALLPMSDNRSSLIWTVNSGQETELLALPDQDFLERLQAHFGYRLGKLTQVGQRGSFPLKMTQTQQPVQQRTVFIGNAAHNLHPIAGQGFNLGLRDVAVLADKLSCGYADCGDAELLHDYQAWQQSDQDNVIRTTDLLVTLFSNDNPILGHARGVGLALLDILPRTKGHLAQRSMGLSSKQARLARGIPL